MFNLETALATWRHQFKYARTFSDQDLDEMERHLRDQVADSVAAGMTPEAAFREAVDEMGGLTDAEAEYDKLQWAKARHQGHVGQELAVRWAMAMGYIKLAGRNLRRNKVPSVINMVGMSIALACCVTVYVFLVAWHSMDNYHANGERIFLAQHDVLTNYETATWGRVPMPLGPALVNDFPQVEQTVRVNWYMASVQHNGAALDESITFVDPSFFDVLTFPLKYGNEAALRDPASVIMSERAVEKYFGEGYNPVGETLVLTFGRQYRETVTIGGVTEAFPSNTGFRFDFLMGFDRQADFGAIDLTDWATMTAGLFVQVRDPDDIATLTTQMDRYVALHNAANPDWAMQAIGFDNFADPSPEVHLMRSRIAEAAHPGLSITFIVMALFMLALSCFNYINIALGSASRRLKEIGMRKVMGSNKRQLILQFMAENILLCLFALVIGTVMAKAFLIPLFNSIFVIQLELTVLGNLGLWAFLVGLLISVGVISGAYPALYIASFQPITIFRGKQKLANNAWFTRAFLTFQFVLAFIAVLMGVLMTMNSHYLIRQDWGYDPAQTLIIELEEQQQYGLLRDAMAQHPDVRQLAGSQTHIGRGGFRNVNMTMEATGETERVMRFDVGPDYLQTLGLRLQAGRFFEAERSGDGMSSVIINQQFARLQGWDDPLGQIVRLDSTNYTVVGMVEDFTFFFLLAPQPTAIFAQTNPAYNYLVLDLNPRAGDDVVAYLEETWAELFPESVLTHFYQDTVFDESYEQYNNVAQAFNAIAALALLIACMGLFGLAMQNIARRMKEVSIRKVVGASVLQLAFLVNRGFLGLLSIAAIIASVLATIGVVALMSFIRYNVPVDTMPLTPWPFLLAYALVFGTAILAIGSQVVRIARTNPAEVLRNE